MILLVMGLQYTFFVGEHLCFCMVLRAGRGCKQLLHSFMTSPEAFGHHCTVFGPWCLDRTHGGEHSGAEQGS